MLPNLIYDIYVLFTVCPSPPVTPEAYDKAKDSVSLKWQMPRHDGRGRIFGYMVEYQKPGAVEWIQANETPEQCPDLHYVVTGLSDGQEYSFMTKVRSHIYSNQNSPGCQCIYDEEIVSHVYNAYKYAILLMSY